MLLGLITDRLPLEENLSIRTTDRDEAVQFVKMYFPEIDARFSERDGLFEFHLNSGVLGQTQLTAHHQYVAGGATFDYTNAPSRLSVEIPIRGRTRVEVNGQTADSIANDTLIVTSPNHDVHWKDDGLVYRCLNLHFESANVARAFRILTGSDRDIPLEFELSADISRPPVSQFLHFALAPFLKHGAAKTVFDFSASTALYEDFLIRTLLTNLRHNRSDELHADAQTASNSTLIRCEDYLQEHADTDVSISDIAEHLGVSIRSLQRTFQNEHGTTPMRRLKQIRLERVRSRLLNADVNESITNLAFASGFTHLGAFAADYKKRFGETPSETRKRVTIRT